MSATLRLALAILFPILAMGVWVGETMQGVASGLVVQFKVRGYDPRDLLAGHYIRYQVDYGLRDLCSNSAGTEQCLCLYEPGSDGIAQALESRPCQTAGGNGCALFVRGHCTAFGRFEAGIERYYFSEEYSQYLMRAPENSQISVSVDRSGRAVVVDFRPDGKSIPQYVADLQQTPEPSP